MGKIKVDDLLQEIGGGLEEWAGKVTEGIKKDVSQTATECLKEVQAHSPEKYGRYKKGWRIKKAYEGETTLRVVIHNKTDYQLTHLLEHGHQMPGAQPDTRSIPHIRPAEQAAEKKLKKRVIVTVGGLDDN